MSDSSPSTSAAQTAPPAPPGDAASPPPAAPANAAARQTTTSSSSPPAKKQRKETTSSSSADRSQPTRKATSSVRPNDPTVTCTPTIIDPVRYDKPDIRRFSWMTPAGTCYSDEIAGAMRDPNLGQDARPVYFTRSTKTEQQKAKIAARAEQELESFRKWKLASGGGGPPSSSSQSVERAPLPVADNGGTAATPEAASPPPAAGAREPEAANA